MIKELKRLDNKIKSYVYNLIDILRQKYQFGFIVGTVIAENFWNRYIDRKK